MAVDYDGSLLTDGQRVLEDYYDKDYEPDQEEIRSYCRIIGLDYEKEPDLVYIAVEGLKAPLPKGWKPIQKPGTNREIYYFNFVTGESQWEHPCDQFYKDMLERERGKLKQARGRTKEGESGRKVAGLDLLPGASGLLRGGVLAHDLPPLRGLPSAGTTGVKLGPLGSQKAQFGQGPPLKKEGSPGSRFLKSPVSAVSDASQTTGSPALGMGVSPDFEHPSVSPGASYLKPTAKQTGNNGGPNTRSAASFELGKNIVAQFEGEDGKEDDDDGSDQSSTILKKLADSISELQKVVQEEGTAKVGRLEVSLRFTFGNETDVPPDSKMLSTSPRLNQLDSTDGSYSNGYGSPPNTSTPKSGHSRNNSQYSPNISATEKCVSEFLKQYKELMLDRVVAKEIAVKLFDKGLLPESVVTSVRNADSEYNANSILWSHASKHYEFQSCLMLCVVMERENGYPKMKILGTRMREELEKYKDEYIACDNRMLDPF